MPEIMAKYAPTRPLAARTPSAEHLHTMLNPHGASDYRVRQSHFRVSGLGSKARDLFISYDGICFIREQCLSKCMV
jgi:hypothetical protein